VSWQQNPLRVFKFSNLLPQEWWFNRLAVGYNSLDLEKPALLISFDRTKIRSEIDFDVNCV
jgi:hypothetical protein